MATTDALYAEYEAFHANVTNKLCHFIGIPLIVATLIGLLLRWDFFTVGRFGVSAGYLVLAGATLFYLIIAPSLALPMLAVAAFLGTLGRVLPLWWAVGLFVLGWVFQFVGHLGYEKKSPAFLKNAGHLLIGPLWVLETAMGRR